MLKGSCLCGAVAFEVAADAGDVDICHCLQCRKWTGHFLSSVGVPHDALSIRDDSQLAWYASSDKARRGFCRQCGSSLFFDPLDRQKHDWTAILLGALDGTPGLRPQRHIFVAEKGDYYDINDGLPQNEY